MFRPLQALRAAWTFVQIVRDPNQLDKVFDLIATAQRDQDVILDKLSGNPAVAGFLANPWRMECPDVDQLARLPEGSLGRVFADHLRSNNLDAAALFRPHGEGPLEDLNAHFEQTHDIWHALTGFTTDVQGEVGLQAFYIAQIEGPPPVAIVSAALLHVALLSPDDIVATMDAINRGWRLGRNAKQLFGVRWDEYWETPLTELREQFGLTVETTEHRTAA